MKNGAEKTDPTPPPVGPPRGFIWQLQRSVRYGVLDLLSRWSRWRRSPQAFQSFNGVIWLCLHHVTRAEQQSFADFVDWLQKNFQVISYSQAVQHLVNGTGSGPRLAFSFDDGLENHLAAGKILAERHLSACFFVCPGIVGKPVGPETAKFCVERLRISPTSFLDWSQIEQLKSWGQEIGGHTQDHLNLAQLTADQVIEQLSRSREILCQRLGGVEHFAWPYGRFTDFNLAGFNQVFELGYQSCASGVRGSHMTATSPGANRICIRREQTEMNWPRAHCEFFLERSSQSPLADPGSLPANWH